MRTVKIDILGDVCISNYDKKAEELCEEIERINKLFGNVDYRLADFEGVIEKENSSSIVKDGPNLSMNKKMTELLINRLDVDAYCVANNHVGDFGVEGAKATVDFLHEKSKEVIGFNEYRGDYKALIKEINGLKIAFLATCENEFGIATIYGAGVAGFCEAEFYREIESVKKNVDKLIVIFHGGIEYYPFPTVGMKKRYRNMIDAGADVVVGMHQHCPCGYELYGTGIICYGIGNFFFPDISFYEAWEVGYIARFTIGKTIRFERIPFCNEDGRIRLVDIKQFERYIEKISKPISEDGILERYLDYYCELRNYNPVSILTSECDKNTDSSLAKVKNLFSCESHREMIIRYLEKQLSSLVDEDYSESEKQDVVKAIRIKEALQLSKKIDMISEENVDCVHIIWGMNQVAKNVLRQLRQSDANSKIVLVDKSDLFSGMRVENTIVKKPEDVLKNDERFIFHICVNKRNYGIIMEKLRNIGIFNERVIWHE